MLIAALDPLRSCSFNFHLRFLAVGAITVQCMLGANTDAGSSLTGLVVDDSGKPIAQARLLISLSPSVTHKISAPPVITGPLAATVYSDGAGNFRADGLAPGQYIVCAEASELGFLDPCHWSTSAPVAAIAIGRATPGVRVIMAKGSIVKVRVEDLQRLLKSAAVAVDLDLEIHVVTPRGIHYHAAIQSSTGVGREHTITVPFNTPLTLRVFSAHLTINDQSGRPFPATGVALNVPAGSNPIALVVAIGGKK